MSKKKQKKHGFVLKMFPGNKKTRERTAVLLTILMFVISLAIFVDAKNSFYDDSKVEAFAERVNNTQVK